MNPLDALRSIKRPSLKRPSFKRPSLKKPSLPRPSLPRPSFSIPSPWLIGTLLLVALWIGWAIYVAADRGLNEGLGVLVAWPTLLLLAALVTAPIAGIVYLVVKLVRGQRREAIIEAGGDPDENITDRTFPL